MNKYRFMFIDAQILITTGVYAIMNSSPGGRVSQNDLARMFILSVFKIVREIGCDRPFLVWDSSPYHKSAILTELVGKDDYKGDRGYKTADDVHQIGKTIVDLENQIKSLQEEDPILHDAQISELTEQIEKYKKQIYDIETQIHNFQVRSATKYFIIKELGRFGFTSIILKGWECDDICTLLADWCHANGHKALLVSKDSDYDFMLNPSTEKYNHWNKSKPTPENPNPKFKTFEDISKEYWWVARDFPDKKLHEVKAIMDSAWGSHNALKRTVKSEWCKAGVFLKDALDHGPDAFEDYDRFNAQLETFNFSRYPRYDFIKECLPWYLKQGGLDTKAEFAEWLNQNKIRVNPNGYDEIIRTVNYEEYPPILNE